MNIKEREEYLMSKLDAMRFGGGNEEVEKPKLDTSLMPPPFDWNRLVRPPLISYIPQAVIDQLYNITTEPRLMSNGKKKFDLINQTLEPYGFFPLASGTNRRAFYCEYDPSVILKIGSDRIGRSDNISEYWIQQVLKPFCCKVFEVHPSGVVSLIERVETMKEDDYKNIWSGEIFDLIMNLLYRGYMLEDVGGNYFKNWAIRIGFGPVLIDFPYLYSIDWSKLRCIARDENGIQCGGELDYDYQKGMSEIVCSKCGKRYAANYLAKQIPDNVKQIYRKGKVFNMADTNKFQFTIMRGDTVIHASYNEVNPQPENNGPIITVVKRSESKKQRNQMPETNVNDEEIRPVFRASVQRTPVTGDGNSTQTTNSTTKTTTSNDLTIEDMGAILDLVHEVHGKRMAINLARKLNVYYKTPNERGTAPAVQPRRDQQRPSINAPVSVRAVPQVEEEVVEIVQPVQPKLHYQKQQTDNLFPVIPKTAEELQREESANRQEKGSILGVPGEPAVLTMKLRNAVPELKNMIIDKYDKKIELTSDSILAVTRLEEGIKQLIASKIASVTNSDSKGLDVMVNTSTDTQNRTIFAIEIEHYKSPILQMSIYPKNINTESSTADLTVRKIEPGINPLEAEVDTDEEFMVKKSRSYSAKFAYLNDGDFTTAMSALLVTDLQSERKKSFDEALDLVENFIKKRTDKPEDLNEEIVNNY